ncbi:SDR family NAD(P)-dependent oxidoreductase [Streptomyces fuscichromogenes]|uniref:SDR family NAD(P)-dependent oxidoreductase n=1 Tax=Streptomyces fuscichromogenes TaxID=1324013 RepID=UPI003802C597
MSLTGKVALVTGASSGIGEATAKGLAARGAKVVIADVVDIDAQRVVDDIKTAGGEAAFVHTDVADEAEAAAAVEFAVSTYGGLHLAHNNAGVVQPPSTFEDLDASVWRRVIDIDLTGVFFCMKAEIAHMVNAGGGSIVNTASGAGLKAAPGLPAYTAAKHGVVGLTRAAALDYAARGVRVNAIAPGPIATPMVQSMPEEMRQFIADAVPMKRLGQSAEVAGLVAFLLSDEAGFITGTTVEIDGASLQSSMGM